MRIEWSTLALQTVNFAVLVWLLHRFLYRPVLRMIDERRAEIEKQFAEANQSLTQVKLQMASIEADRAGIASERTAILESAAAEAEVAAIARRAAVEREATALLDSTRKTLANERTEVLAEARRTAQDLGERIARKLLAAVPLGLQPETWLEGIVGSLAGLPRESLEDLTQQVAQTGGLKVVTASALSPEATEQWLARFQRTLGPATAVSFEVQENLFAGAELHFPHAILRFSWGSALETIRAQIGAHADAR